MEENKKNAKASTAIYIRAVEEDKQKCIEMAKFYGMPNYSTFIRELIRKQYEVYLTSRKDK